MQHERDGWVWPPVGTRLSSSLVPQPRKKKKKNAAHGRWLPASAPLVCMGVLGAAAAAAALVQSFHSINGHLANTRAVGVKSVPVWNLHVFITRLLPTLHNSGQ